VLPLLLLLLLLTEYLATMYVSAAPAPAAAWYKLMTRDMGPYSRCIGKAPTLPPPQPFQLLLPAPKTPLPDFGAVRSEIINELRGSSAAAESDTAGGKPYYGETSYASLELHELSRLVFCV
jgi:hypothetical protein